MSALTDSAWQSLPCPVFAQLLPGLSPRDYAAIRCCCKSWRSSLANTLLELAPLGPRPAGWATRFPALQVLDWSRCICPVTDSDMAQLCALPRLRYLDCTPLENTKELSAVTDRGLAMLKGLPMLTYLNLSSCRLLTDAGVAQLAGMPLARVLSTLSLSNCRLLSDSGLSYMQHLQSLQHLCLYGLRDVTSQGITCLQKLPLITLDLRLCKGVTNLALEALKHVTTLTELDLTGCDAITDMGVYYLGRLTRLRTLRLDACRNLTDHSLAALSPLTNLSTLGASMWRNLHGDGLIELPTGITYLNLSWTPRLRSVDSLQALASTLLSLDLQHSGVTDLRLHSLGLLTALQALSLAGCPELQLSGQSPVPRAISRLPALQTLDLSDDLSVRDAHLHMLRNATSLTSLSLLRCKAVTDVGLRHLCALPRLAALNVIGCFQISPAALTELRASRPQLCVKHSHAK